MFRLLYNSESEAGFLDGDLLQKYGSGLRFAPAPAARPFIYSNFVTSLDGMIAFGEQRQSEGRLISQKSAADQWLMGLLRGMADAVIIGAGNLRAETGHTWTPDALAQADTGLLHQWRRENGKPQSPLQCIVTASGNIDPGCRVFESGLPTVILTTTSGSRNLSSDLNQGTVIISDGTCGGIDWQESLRILKDGHNVQHALCEGGALLFGSLMKERLVDECFQTLSPMMLGPYAFASGRRGLIEGVSFQPTDAPTFKLVSARTGELEEDMLFLRYRRLHPGRTDG